MAARTSAVWAFEAIGTAWSVETAEPLGDDARDAVRRIVADFDRAWSRFRDDSLVARLSASGGSVPAPPDAEAMLAMYAELDEATAGAVDPLVGDALARLGYDARLRFSNAPAVAHAPAAVDEARSGDAGTAPTARAPAWRDALTCEAGLLSLTTPATIDVGALGKGRLVDLVMAEVRAHAPGDAVVDASGDLAVRGRTQRVALEHPYRFDRAIGAVEVTDAALCASAITRRAWGDGLHHVLDARTGRPVRAYAATWAIAPTAMQADALATALFFDGGPELAARWGLEWVRMRTDGAVQWSSGSTVEVFS